MNNYIGKIVSRKGRKKKEFGVVVDVEGTEYIRFDNQKENDMEELLGLPFEEEPEYQLKFINKKGELL